MYALVDCNSCYASCEQIFRPDLRDKPVVVLSNNDGCIIARSKEAKALGIPDLLPYFKIKPLLEKHKVTVFSANFRFYGDISKRFCETLKRFTPEMEIYSIDEVFLSLEGQKHNLQILGEIMKQTIWREVRMPVGVGIAPTKTLAKLANHFAKRHKDGNGICVLDTKAKWEWALKRVPVRTVWGIGEALSNALKKSNINSAYDLSQASAKHLRKLFSVNIERTIKELNGQPSLSLDELPPAKQQIFVTRSFSEKTNDKTILKTHMSRYAAAAGEKLRKQKSVTQNILVILETGPFDKPYTSDHATVKLAAPTNDSREFIQAALEGLERVYKDGFRYGRCGIGLLDIRSASIQQMDFFTAQQSPQSTALMKTIDCINLRYGRDTAVFASEGNHGKWTMRQSMLSPAYTTRWGDIPRVGC